MATSLKRRVLKTSGVPQVRSAREYRESVQRYARENFNREATDAEINEQMGMYFNQNIMPVLKDYSPDSWERQAIIRDWSGLSTGADVGASMTSGMVKSLPGQVAVSGMNVVRGATGQTPINVEDYYYEPQTMEGKIAGPATEFLLEAPLPAGAAIKGVKGGKALMQAAKQAAGIGAVQGAVRGTLQDVNAQRPIDLKHVATTAAIEAGAMGLGGAGIHAVAPLVGKAAAAIKRRVQKPSVVSPGGQVTMGATSVPAEGSAEPLLLPAPSENVFTGNRRVARPSNIAGEATPTIREAPSIAAVAPHPRPEIIRELLERNPTLAQQAPSSIAKTMGFPEQDVVDAFALMQKPESPVQLPHEIPSNQEAARQAQRMEALRQSASVPVEPQRVLDPGTRYANDQIVDTLAKTEMWYGKDYKLKGNKLGGAVKLIAKGQTDEEIGRALQIDPVYISRVRAHYTDRGFTVPESRNDPRFGIWSEHVRKALDTTKGDYQKAFESLAQIPREKTTGAAGSQTGESRLASWMRSPHEPEIPPQPQIPPVTAEWPAPSVLQSSIKLTNNAIQAIRQYADSTGISPTGALETLAQHTDDAALWEQFRLTPNDAMSIRQAWEAIKSQMISPAPTQIPFNAQDAVARLKQMAPDEARVAFAKLSPEQQAQILALEPPPVRPGVSPLSPEQEQLARQALAMERARQIPPEPGPSLGEPERPFDYAPEVPPTADTVPGLAARVESEAQKGALNAPQEGLQPSGSVSEHSGVGEIRPTRETGSSNRPALSERTTEKTPEDEDLIYLGSGLGGFQGKFEKMFGGNRQDRNDNWLAKLFGVADNTPTAKGASAELGAKQAAASPEYVGRSRVQAEAAANAPSAPQPTGIKQQVARSAQLGPVYEVAGTDVGAMLQRASTKEEVQSAVYEIMKATEPRYANVRRGKITHAQQQALAAELGIDDVWDWDARYTPEELTSVVAKVEGVVKASAAQLKDTARRVLTGEASEGDLLKAFAITDLSLVHSLRHRAAAGRTLNIFKATSSAQSQAKNLREIQAQIKKLGGEARGQKLAQMILDADQFGGPGAAAKLARKALMSKSWAMLTEYYYGSILSGVSTHVANITANALTVGARVAETALAATISTGRAVTAKALGKEAPAERVYWKEVGQQLKGIQEVGLEGAELLLKTIKSGDLADLKTGKYIKSFDDTASTLDRPQEGAIPGLLGKVVRAPGKALVAEDAFFKSLGYRMNMRSMATRVGKDKGLNGQELSAYVEKVMANPPPTLVEKATEAATYQTFTNSLQGEGLLREIGRGTIRARNRHPALTFIVPFVRTLVNTQKYAQERSVLAFIDKDMRKALLEDKSDSAWAKLVMGTGLGAATLTFAMGGNVTGGGPSDPGARQRWLNAGNQPYSMRIGDTWYQYNRFAPWGVIMGVSADMKDIAASLTEEQAKEMRFDEIAKEFGFAVGRSMVKNVTNQTMLSGIVGALNVAINPDRYAPKFVESLLGAAVPNIVAKAAQVIDPTVRDVEGVYEKLLSRLPGKSQTLSPKMTPLGDEIRRNEDPVAAFMYPGSISDEDKKDPIYQEIDRLKINMSIPEDAVTLHGKSITLTPEQHVKMVKEGGQRAKERIGKLISSSRYRLLEKAPNGDQRQVKAIRAIVDEERDHARNRMLREVRRELASGVRERN